MFSKCFRLFWVNHKKKDTFSDNLPIRIFVNKTKNRTTFKIKTGYCPELLLTETMKLLGDIENKKNKDKNGEDIPFKEVIEVVLVHCNIVKNIIDMIQSLVAIHIHLIQVNCSVSYRYFTKKIIVFKTFNSD